VIDTLSFLRSHSVNKTGENFFIQRKYLAQTIDYQYNFLRIATHGFFFPTYTRI